MSKINKVKLDISVHTLVDFLLRSGHIDDRIYNVHTMQEGSAIHKIYQESKGIHYFSEYKVSDIFFIDNFEIKLQGFIDGLYNNGSIYTIEEIKTTNHDLNNYYEDNHLWHLGQAKCYALMLMNEKNLESIDINLVYLSQVTEDKMIKTFSYTYEEIENDVLDLLNQFSDFQKFIIEKRNIRDNSIREMKFPFKNYRNDQLKLINCVEETILNNERIYIEAPTGIGKTISCIYPSVKCLLSKENDKIIYLTAKNSGKESAMNAVDKLCKKNLRISTVCLTAKDKICFLSKPKCNPIDCPFAKHYYTKLKESLLFSLEKYDIFDENTIISIAKRFSICPFELSLDLSLYADIIVGDYNYLFDPFVYLKRIFDNTKLNIIGLIDEAHNLVDRGRDTYSATLDLLYIKNIFNKIDRKHNKKISNMLQKLINIFLAYSFEDEYFLIEDELPITILSPLNSFVKNITSISKKSIVPDFVLDLYYEIKRFLKVYEYYDDKFKIYFKRDKNNVFLNIMCLDPSDNLKNRLELLSSSVIFSATLSPYEYYLDMIEGNQNTSLEVFDSPFSKNNLDVIVAPHISTKYKDRHMTYDIIADYIYTFISGKIGNYIVYVPSYEYMRHLINFFKDIEIDLIIQNKEMTEKDKNKFLSFFKTNPTKVTLGIAVIGGIFGEGIDLRNDRLIGVIVVGVGMPLICYERNLIKEHFNNVNSKGFAYSYIYPGINKIVQSVGRIIRSESDKGAALLIDNRYLTNPYLKNISKKWPNYKVITTKHELEREINSFWQGDKCNIK